MKARAIKYLLKIYQEHRSVLGQYAHNCPGKERRIQTRRTLLGKKLPPVPWIENWSFGTQDRQVARAKRTSLNEAGLKLDL